MSVDLPAFHAGTLMVRVRPKLFKLGWKQMDNGRLDCTEKVFGDIKIGTIWAGDQLLLNPKKLDGSYVGLDIPEIKQAIEELQQVFDRTVRRNKKQWNKEIREYEEKHNIVFTRNKRYGV